MRVLVALSLLFSSIVFANGNSSLSKTQVLNLISEYKQAPISETGYAAVKKIINFAENSKDVLVEVTPETTPWLTHDKVSDPIKGLLLGAYVVGNIEPQLMFNEKKPQHCSGANEVARVVKLIIRPNAAAEIRLIEQLNKASLNRYDCSKEKQNQALNSAE